MATIKGDPFRKDYGQLTDEQKRLMATTKTIYENTWQSLTAIEMAFGPSRDLSLAKTDLQNSCMWAVRAITKMPGQE